MAVQKQFNTTEDFIEFALQPENSEREFELVNGQVIGKLPGTTRNSELAGLVAFEVRLFCRNHNLSCYTCGGNGALRVDNHVLVPDFAYKHTRMSNDYPDPIPPLWVVEVISPTDKPHEVRAKRQVYLQAGILYWELYSEDRSVDVYVPDQPMRTYRAGEVVGVGDLIPDFTLAVSDLFEQESLSMTQPMEHNPLLQQRTAQIAQLPGQLRWFGDPVLRGITTPFSLDEIERGDSKALADELASVLGYIRQTTDLGRAIAAPQIGVLRRMFVAYNPETNSFDTFTNPLVVSASQTLGVYREMCLSGIPLSGEVIRPWEIEIEYVDPLGNILKRALDPIGSRIAQHEIDHLDGILFIDRAVAKSLAFDFDWETMRQRNQLRKLE